ncbi:hypothetical protein, partial [Haloarcula sp. CBA1122]|uniref:hypothetical protein n=1 Tax=Haloarcula sp. CBA1122 TaxID=2668069 RepID=UPI001C255EDC
MTRTHRDSRPARSLNLNIDQSEPYIDSIDVPSEARPDKSFTVTVTVGNESSIIAPQDGTCQ